MIKKLGKIQHPKNSFLIRAYCTTCNGLVQESNPLQKDRLKETWQSAVLSAPLILKCKKCSDKNVNFNLRFKIYCTRKRKELDPAVLNLNISAKDITGKK